MTELGETCLNLSFFDSLKRPICGWGAFVCFWINEGKRSPRRDL